MEFCPNCGATLYKKACPHCGADFSQQDSPGPETTAAAAPAGGDDPLMDAYTQQIEQARQMVDGGENMERLENAFQKMEALREKFPDDSQFIMEMQQEGLVQEYSQAYAAVTMEAANITPPGDA